MGLNSSKLFYSFANTILYNLLSLALSIYHHTTLAVMRKTFFFFYAFLLVVVSASAQVKLQNLLTENLTNPIGIDVQRPRFSWQLVSDQRNVTQTAYEITVNSGKSNMWKSGKIMSDQSVHVPYAGTALQPGKKYTWEVRVWDNNGKPSPWSEPAFFQTAFFNQSDPIAIGWKAKWIEADFIEDSINRPAQYFRKQFSTTKK
jgi:alpha-L-rhamnosidase